MSKRSITAKAAQMRLFLAAFFVALLIPVAGASAADKVANPGQFQAEITGGMLKMNALEVPIDEIQPAPTLTGNVNAAGDIVIPSSGVNFPPLQFDLEGNLIDIYILPTGTDWVGSIDPDSGEFSLEARLRVQAKGKPMGIDLGSSCFVGASGTGNNLHLNPMTTASIPANGEQPAMEGQPYDSDSGDVVVVNNTVTVPAASGCGPLGLADGTLNDELGLPSASGNNSMSLGIKFTQNPPAAPAVARYSVDPDSGRIPFDVDFDASASTSTLGEIDEYRWDFDGDGEIDKVTTEPTVSHTYDTTGVFRTRLTISTQGYETTRSRATVTARAVIASYTETPPHFTKERNATFAFEANEEGATFECLLLKNGEPVAINPPDEGEEPGEEPGEGEGEEPTEPAPIDYEACDSPVDFIDLEDADYTMNVRAIGADDGAKGLPAVWEFRVDNVAPSTTITAKPPAFYNQTSYPVAFAASEPGSTFECRILQDVPAEDDGEGEGEGEGEEPTEPTEPEWEACESGDPAEWARVEGPVTFEVRATDRAGNLGDPTSASWELDFTAPVSSVPQGPPSPTTKIGGSPGRKCSTVVLFGSCVLGEWLEASSVGDASQAFTLASNEPEGSYVCSFNDGEERPCVTGIQTGTGYVGPEEDTNLRPAYKRVGNPQQGPNTLKVWAIDRAGNRQAEPTTYTFVYDTIPPVVTAMAKPAEFTKSVNNTVIFQSNEPVTKFECKVINNTGSATTAFPANTSSATGFAPCSPGLLNPTMGWQTADGQSDGRKGLQVRATDIAGNTQTTNNGVLNDGGLTLYWTVDNAPPVASFGAGSVQEGSYTTSSSATINLASTDTPINFGVNANGIAPQQPSYECSLNNAAFTACSTPVQLSGLTAGPKSFRVRVTDQATNVSAIAERKWTVVDNSNASVTLTQTPPAVSGVRTATFGFTPDDGSAECRIDATESQNSTGSGWSACSSTKEYTGLAEGNHQVEIRANSSSVPAVYNFAVYANVPTVSFNSQPGIARPDGKRYTGLDQNSASITFSSPANPGYAPGATTHECRYYDSAVAAGPWEDCASPVPVTWNKQDDGKEMVFEVRPTSSTGNQGGVQTTKWTIVSTRPDVALGNTGSVATACGNGVANGSGPAGCVATGSSTQPWTRSNVTAPRFQATTTKPIPNAVGFACQLNGNAVQNPCTGRTSGFTGANDVLTVLMGGSRGNGDNLGNAIAQNSENTLKIWAVDIGGNMSDPVTYTWVHDSTVPTFSIPASSAPARTNLGTVDDPMVVKIEASENMHPEKGFACRLINNGTTSTNGTNPGSNPNSPGSGWETCPMDLNDPEDPGAGFDLRHASWTSTTLAEGNYALDVRGWDTVWNVATGTSSSTRPNVADNNANGKRYIFTVDRTAPVVNITGGPAQDSILTTTEGEFTFAPNEAAGQIDKTECRLDPADPDDLEEGWEACSGNFPFSELEDGAHVFQVRSLDTAGNQGNPTTREWTVDTSKPEIDLQSNLTGEFTNQTAVELTFTVEPADSSLECRLTAPEGYPAVPVDPDDEGEEPVDPEDEGEAPAESEDEGDEPEEPVEAPFEACSSPVELTDMIDGDYTFEVKSVNTLGTEGDIAKKSWTVDTVAPDVAIDSGPSGAGKSKSAELTFSSSDSSVTFRCDLDGDVENGCESPVSYSGLSDGDHTFTVVAVDRAGNESAPASRSWSVDTAAPTTAITSGPTGTVNVPTAAFEFNSDKAGSSFECKLGNGNWEACSSPKSYSGLGDGDKTFQVRATDTVGNEGPVTIRTWTVDLPKCEDGKVGTPPNCEDPKCPEGKVGTPPNCEDPKCPEGKVGEYPDCKDPVAEKCASNEIGTPPNCKKQLPAQPNPTNVTGVFDGKVLTLKLKCPPAMKPKCIGNAVAVTGKGKGAKVMSSKVKSNSKAGKFKTVKITIKAAYRDRVLQMTTVNKKQLVIKQTVKSKKKKKRNVFHTYKVRAKA